MGAAGDFGGSTPPAGVTVGVYGGGSGPPATDDGIDGIPEFPAVHWSGAVAPVLPAAWGCVPVRLNRRRVGPVKPASTPGTSSKSGCGDGMREAPGAGVPSDAGGGRTETGAVDTGAGRWRSAGEMGAFGGCAPVSCRAWRPQRLQSCTFELRPA